MEYSLDERVELLLIGMRSINSWIKNNPNTDPNLFEMTDNFMEFGNLVSYYTDEVYKEKSKNDNMFSSHAVMPFVYENHPIILDLDNEVRLMMQYRGASSFGKKKEDLFVNFQKEQADNGLFFVKSDFFSENNMIANFLRDIHYSALTNSFDGENKIGKENFAIKKRTLAKLAGVYLYIWQEKQKNSNFVYDNESEFKMLQDGIDCLEDLNLDIFGKYVNYMFDYIKSNYKYNTNLYDSSDIKTI